MDCGIRISTHGVERISKRMGIPVRAVARQAENAFVRGHRRSRFKGEIRKYLDALFVKGCDTQAATDIVVHGNHIFLFAGRILVTSWPVPNKYRQVLDHAYAKKAKGFEEDGGLSA